MAQPSGVVLVAVRRGVAVIHDPARGRREVKAAELSQRFTGVALELQPQPGFVQAPLRPRVTLRQLLGPVAGLKRSLLQIGLLARITRSAMLEVLRQDYVRTARAKGLSEFSVIAKHAMANVAIPVVTVVGLIFSVLLSARSSSRQCSPCPAWVPCWAMRSCAATTR